MLPGLSYSESVTGLEHLDTRAPFALVALLRTSEFDGASRPDQVMHQLETAIAVGLIGVGERLPPSGNLLRSSA